MVKPVKTNKPNKPTKEIIYGINTIQTLLSIDPSRVIELFLEKKNNTPVTTKVNKIKQLATMHNIAIQQVNTTTLENWFTEPVNHQGIAAHVKPSSFLTEEDLVILAKEQKSPKPIFLALDHIQDPRNLGACIRNAAVMGVTAVIISKNGSCDITPAVKKVASGATEIVPIAKIGNLVNCLKQLQQEGVWVIALDADYQQNLSAIDLTIPIVVVLGSENKGVSNIVKQNSDYLAKIPMVDNGIDSLNLSVAAGICLYEVNRQRIGNV